MHDWEAQLDARLRHVPLPGGLLARLRGIAEQEPSLSDEELAILSDDALDEQLCAVELPEGLLAQMHATVAAAAAGEEIDARLSDVPVPRTLVASLRMIPWQLTHRRRFERVALAAALFIVIGLGYYGALGTWLASLQGSPAEEMAWVEIDTSGVTMQWGTESPATAFVARTEPTIVDDNRLTADPHIERLLAGAMLPEEPTFVSISEPLPPTLEVAREFATRRPWNDIFILKYGVLGSPSEVSDRLPPLESLPRPRSSGFTPPLARGYDRTFLLTEGAHPIVSPGVSERLRRVDVPLTTATDSYDLAWQRLRAARWPAADEMHIADFLAAMDYPLPAARPGEVGIRTAAGPSPFGKEGARLLQVCAQAGPLADAPRQGTHLTVALDVSASMELGGKLEAARRSLRQMLAQMGAGDRLSLLLFNDRDQAEITAATRDDAPELLKLLEQLEASGGTNIAAGLQRGASLAMGATDVRGARRELVLITDGRAPLPHATQQSLVALFRDLQDEGLALAILDLSTDAEPDPDLLRLAKATEAKLKHAASAADAQWFLSDLLVGHPTLVAPDAALRVTFDPTAVAAYRLIGHEPARLAGLEPAVVTLDLRAGQVATGLFEVWLKPNSHDHVALAELSWRDPATGEERRTEQPISRLQFAPTFAEASLSLQAAAVAAETGEVLRESPFADSRARGLAEVLTLAQKVNPRLADRPGYRRFVSFIEAAERFRVEKVVP